MIRMFNKYYYYMKYAISYLPPLKFCTYSQLFYIIKLMPFKYMNWYKKPVKLSVKYLFTSAIKISQKARGWVNSSSSSKVQRKRAASFGPSSIGGITSLSVSVLREWRHEVAIQREGSLPEIGGLETFVCGRSFARVIHKQEVKKS